MKHDTFLSLVWLLKNGFQANMDIHNHQRYTEKVVKIVGSPA
jgi:hypothetical protein